MSRRLAKEMEAYAGSYPTVAQNLFAVRGSLATSAAKKYMLRRHGELRLSSTDCKSRRPLGC